METGRYTKFGIGDIVRWSMKISNPETGRKKKILKTFEGEVKMFLPRGTRTPKDLVQNGIAGFLNSSSRKGDRYVVECEGKLYVPWTNRLSLARRADQFTLF